MTDPARVAKERAKAVLLLSGLVTLLWPVAVFACAFVGIDTSRGAASTAANVCALLLLVSYPWGFLVGGVRILIARKRGEIWHTRRTLLFLWASVLQPIFTVLLVIPLLSLLDR